jgi:hypothetical protein
MEQKVTMATKVTRRTCRGAQANCRARAEGLRARKGRKLASQTLEFTRNFNFRARAPRLRSGPEKKSGARGQGTGIANTG